MVSLFSSKQGVHKENPWVERISPFFLSSLGSESSEIFLLNTGRSFHCECIPLSFLFVTAQYFLNDFLYHRSFWIQTDLLLVFQFSSAEEEKKEDAQEDWSQRKEF